MTTRRLIATAVALIVTAGCATPYYWTKPGLSEADFYRDDYACIQTSSRDTFQWRHPAAGGPRYGPQVDQVMYRACMKAQGYRLVEGDVPGRR